MENLKILKHGKKITKDSYREELQFGCIRDNNIFFTDGKRMLKIKHNGYEPNNTLIDMNGHKTDNKGLIYPRTDQSIPDYENKSFAHLNLWYNDMVNLLSFLKCLKSMGLDRILIELNSLNESEYTFKIPNEIKNNEDHNFKNINMEFTIDYNMIRFNNEIDKVSRILLNINYLINALELCKEYKKHAEVKSFENKFYISILNKFKPIVITDTSKDFEYIICPMRY